MSPGLDRDDILSLLDDLNDELRSRGAHAELFLVGGAALTLVYDATRSTRDLDAVFVPTSVVRSAAAAVAERRGQEADWLNDAVKGFLPGSDPEAIRFYEGDALTVDVASARYLLAMKLGEIVESLADRDRPQQPASARAIDPLAAARRHAEETAAAQEQMLASARARRAAILEAHDNGMSVRRIAAELNCSPAVVQEAIRLGRTEVRTEGDESQ